MGLSLRLSLNHRLGLPRDKIIHGGLGLVRVLPRNEIIRLALALAAVSHELSQLPQPG